MRRMPRAYQLSRGGRGGGRPPLPASSYSAAPNRWASRRSMTTSSPNPRATRMRTVVSGSICAQPRRPTARPFRRPPSVIPRPFGASPGRPPAGSPPSPRVSSAACLPSASRAVPLAGDVPTVTLGQHVLAHRPHGLARDHVRSDRGLNRNLEHLAGDELLELLDQRAAGGLRALAMDDERQGVHWLAVDHDVDLGEV